MVESFALLVRMVANLKIRSITQGGDVTDLTHDCLEKMDQLIHQSARGIHILFEKADIVRAIRSDDPSLEENTVEKLKLVQELLYKFIRMKSVEEKRGYLQGLSHHDHALLIRAYFKIVDNSILNKTIDKH
jgi:hypothetical protein